MTRDTLKKSLATQIATAIVTRAKKVAIVAIPAYLTLDWFNVVPGFLNNLTAQQQLQQVQVTQTDTINRAADTVLSDLNQVDNADIKIAYSNAVKDGIIDKVERNNLCQLASGNTAKLDAVDNIISQVRNKRIPLIKLSSPNLKGCSRI